MVFFELFSRTVCEIRKQIDSKAPFGTLKVLSKEILKENKKWRKLYKVTLYIAPFIFICYICDRIIYKYVKN